MCDMGYGRWTCDWRIGGYLVGKLVIYLRVYHHAALELEKFLTLGLIAPAYGIVLLAHTFVFLLI
jgi:hypothetical protein